MSDKYQKFYLSLPFCDPPNYSTHKHVFREEIVREFVHFTITITIRIVDVDDEFVCLLI